MIASLQARYAEATGVRGLKIRHNNVLGYFVEVSATHADKLREGASPVSFIHRQTLAGGVRFSTPELAELDAKIAQARADQVPAARASRLGSAAARA